MHDPRPTRSSLIRRLKDACDDDAWREFYGTYGGLIRRLALKAGLRDGANHWRGVHRQALGNDLRVDAIRGRLVAAYPPVVAVDRRGRAELEILGGTGYLPVTFTGLRRSRGWSLQSIDASGSASTVDQSVHGRDFWQAAHDPVSGTWRLTFNLPRDANADAPVARRLILSP